ncbi:unnamed protein product [Paramecium pentaurelia]|uniref:H-type lectin domain-containing protein n=1 Tax=Paramecium pentaurelia TaxID=43138 RepID=A0A8S1YQ76_9CILI|nr:unnamed protein product [Paramecium pentaurelia]
MFIFHIIFSIISVYADHLFESGEVSHFNYASNPNLILYTTTTKFRQEELFIPFAKQFSSVPDVYLNIMLMDFEHTFPQGYSLDITSISTMGFTVKVVCESTEQYYGFHFNWFAFNDESVQVINNLNITYPNSQYTHSYNKNCKINVALSNFVSYYAVGPQFNNLTGLSLTSESVTISFYNENLKQFGYQILLSSSDFILIGPTITDISLYGSSQIVSFPSGWDTQNCYPQLLGLKHDGTAQNLRLSGSVTYSPGVTVGFYPWFTSIIQSLQYNYFCINDAYFDLAVFGGLVQTKFFETKHQIETHIEISEINYYQNQNIEEEITIQNGIQFIQIIYYWKCLGYEQLKLQLFCPEVWCSSIQVQCNINKTNTIRLKAKFSFTISSQQYINIIKTSTSFIATQIIKQQNPFQKVLFKAEMVQ